MTLKKVLNSFLRVLTTVGIKEIVSSFAPNRNFRPQFLVIGKKVGHDESGIGED